MVLAMTLTSRAAILRLLAFGRPAAISRFVRTVIIDSVDRMLRRRSLAHVGEECREVGTPRCTYPNTTRAVIAKACVLRVFTAIDHVCPREIFGRAIHAVFSFVCAIPFRAKATTGQRISHLQIVGGDRFLCAAFASAQPLVAFSGKSLRGWFNNEQASEALTLQVGRLLSHAEYSTVFPIKHLYRPERVHYGTC